jgi:hypothetical protein
MKLPRLVATCFLALSLLCGYGGVASAFCGFYVAKADASLYNQASQVILARDGDRTVVTMANDFQGDVKDFAMVVPVPVVLEQEQVHVGDRQIVERLDAFSSPRLVEYFDPDPCAPPIAFEEGLRLEKSQVADTAVPAAPAANALGVTIESAFSVGEYDILILSAKESTGLETWLNQNGYRIPAKAQPLLQPYIRQGMKFFVAKVNLEAFENAGYQNLRPLQIAYNSPKFMLPIRLGMANAREAQDLIVYALSPKGQVELTNYRTVKVPSDVDIPVFVKDEFEKFYKATFQKVYETENRRVAFLEYAWDITSCDPCSAEPPSAQELRQAGAFWIQPDTMPNAFITRLHVRYTPDTFPEDLTFQETSNRESFQGRYVLRHPFTGNTSCSAGEQYRRSLPTRFEAEAQTLARLTGWNIDDIRAKLPATSETLATPVDPWWQELWGK